MLYLLKSKEKRFLRRKRWTHFPFSFSRQKRKKRKFNFSDGTKFDQRPSLDDFKMGRRCDFTDKWKIFFCHVKNGSFVHPRMVIGSSLDCCVVSSKKKRRGISFVGRKKEIITTIASYNIYTHLLYVRDTPGVRVSLLGRLFLFTSGGERRGGRRWRAKEPKSQPSERSPPQSWSSH